MSRFVDLGFRAVEALLVVLLAVLVCLVFTNVVLRYAFDSGIIATEEISRLVFVWIVFVGAVPVMRLHGHLGVDMFVESMPARGRFLATLTANLVMLGCCVIFGWGTWRQSLINADNAAPITGIATGWAYAAATISAVSIGIIVLADLVRLIRTGEPVRAQPGGDVA
ncbi:MULTISPECIES: TRAP transporter small permease [unclassified Chelatococcus]|uniref:TRAP transporter small permease n=1 Tax=unclassified Chelatococcus TaxID=2638111 RepID=UPI0003088BF5|nr:MULTISPECIES: TRAP transporter small permease [unclassified Chelatococcus]ALA20231.1 ABC transporter permease [Chelatococcus sp. CO-6]